MCVAAMEFGPGTKASDNNPNRCEVKFGNFDTVMDFTDLTCEQSSSLRAVRDIDEQIMRSGMVPKGVQVKLGSFECKD